MKLKTLACLSLITLVAYLNPVARAQTFSVIHAFNGTSDGSQPVAGVTIKQGSLYGTAGNGGGDGWGTVYQIVRSGDSWVTVLMSILSHGEHPYARVNFGPDGHPYTTTVLGGDYKGGDTFYLTPPGTICKVANCFWKENVLHQFSGPPDGAYPRYGDLVWDQEGNIYGTTEEGGDSNNGTVYELQPSGNGWTESILYSFSGGEDGKWLENGVVLDKSGDLFGTTFYGGLNGYGTVFELTYRAGVGWVKTVLYIFQNGTDGSGPVSGVILDNSGNLYGATSDGGSGGGGTVFELTPAGNGYTFNLLYSFSGIPGQNCGPFGSLAMDDAGNLYGTTVCDGTHNLGNVFKLTNTENGWDYTSLHDFTGGSDGKLPYASTVTIDADGTLYGTAAYGGSFVGNYCINDGCGVVWMIKP